MSPECLTRREYSIKTDIYSFGIVMYEVITREIPFADLDIMQVGIQVSSGQTTIIDCIKKDESYNSLLIEIMKVSFFFFFF